MEGIPSRGSKPPGFDQIWKEFPMSRRNQTFVCQNCGAASARWQGKCEACGEWNSMVEEGDGLAGLGGVAGRPAGPGRTPPKGRSFALQPPTRETHEAPRLPSGLPELARVP